MLLASGCSDFIQEFNSNNNEEENDMDIVIEKKLIEIMGKIDNEKPCESITRVYDYFSIPGYSEIMSMLPALSDIKPSDIECARIAGNKEYVYIIYKTEYESANYWVFYFYKSNRCGDYIADSVLFINDNNGFGSTLNYTLDDLLDIDKEFVNSLTSNK